MANKKRLPSRYALSDSDSSDQDIPLNGHVTPPPPPEKLVEEPSSDTLRSRKKRKATLTCFAQDPKRIWSLNDELVILKGIVTYRNETGVDYLSDSSAFLDHIKNDIESRNSKGQLMSKIRRLKQKFRDNLAKGSSCFANKSHDSVVFNLSMAIWGNDKAECVDGNMDKANGTKSKVRASVEHEAATDGEPENDDGSAEGDSSDEKLPCGKVDKSTENETGGKESEEREEAVTNGKPKNDDGSAKGDSSDGDDLPCEKVGKRRENETGGKEESGEREEAVRNGKPKNDDGSAKDDSCDERLPCEKADKRMEKKEDGGKESEGDGADDEMCALQDVLETTMFQHLSNHARKLMLQKLKTLGGKERKELSDEWKALLVQEMLLMSKKQTFAAKLAKAASRD